MYANGALHGCQGAAYESKGVVSEHYEKQHSYRH